MPALAVDFMSRYHLPVREYLQAVSWNEAWELIKPLLYDPYSHVIASLRGHQRPPYPAEEAPFTWAEFYAQMHRSKNQVPPRRIQRPWEAPRDVAKPKRSELSKAEGRRKLNEKLGL